MHREFALPTFNYDFCKNGIYDVENSPSQVGVLSNYYREKYSQERTKTPVFNFCVRNRKHLSLDPVENCFGSRSLFSLIRKGDGVVAFLGADFSSNTMIHHIEELMDVQYRFHKTFTGRVFFQGDSHRVKLIYRVRPANFPCYNWPKLQGELEERGLLHSHKVGAGKLLFYRASTVANFWCEKMKHSPSYLLHSVIA